MKSLLASPDFVSELQGQDTSCFEITSISPVVKVSDEDVRID
jgi:hypothetical protein